MLGPSLYSTLDRLEVLPLSRVHTLNLAVDSAYQPLHSIFLGFSVGVDILFLVVTTISFGISWLSDAAVPAHGTLPAGVKTISLSNVLRIGSLLQILWLGPG